MLIKLKRFWRDQSGVTALEYGILAAVVAVIIGGVFYTQLSTTMSSLFTKVNTAVTNSAPTTTSR